MRRRRCWNRGALAPKGHYAVMCTQWYEPTPCGRLAVAAGEYAYDNPEEPTPHELVSGIENAGFSLVEQEILECDPRAVGWDAIQSCIFSKN